MVSTPAEKRGSQGLQNGSLRYASYSFSRLFPVDCRSVSKFELYVLFRKRRKRRRYRCTGARSMLSTSSAPVGLR
jgi:hypothetical protein